MPDLTDTVVDTAASLAGQLSADFEAEGRQDDPLQAVSLRIPLPRLAVIDAMAKKAHESRNTIANQLLAAGIKDVFDRLSPEVADELISEIEENL